MVTQNLSAGPTAYAYMQWQTDTGSAFIWKNSSTRSIDGGIRTVTFRNDEGDVRIATAGNTSYLYLQASNGCVGINKLAPTAALDVNGNVIVSGAISTYGTQSINASNNGDSIITSQCTNSVNYGYLCLKSASYSCWFACTNIGSIGMWTSGGGGVQLNYGGNSWGTWSDVRKKKNIQILSYGLPEINRLNPVRFDYKTDTSESSKRMGFIAQEVIPVIPEAVFGTEETEYSLAVTDLIPAMVNAIKELSSQNAKLLNFIQSKFPGEL